MELNVWKKVAQTRHNIRELPFMLVVERYAEFTTEPLGDSAQRLAEASLLRF